MDARLVRHCCLFAHSMKLSLTVPSGSIVQKAGESGEEETHEDLEIERDRYGGNMIDKA